MASVADFVSANWNLVTRAGFASISVVGFLDTFVSQRHATRLRLAIVSAYKNYFGALMPFAFEDVTAVQGVHYVPLATQLLIPASKYYPQVGYLEIDLLQVDQARTFKVTIDANNLLLNGLFTGTRVSPTHKVCTVTIQRVAGPEGVVGFLQPTMHHNENQVINIPVVRTNGFTGAVSVDYTTEDDTALAGVDYVAASDTLSWGDGDSSQKIIPVTINPISGGDKQFQVRLTDPVGGVTLDLRNPATVLIFDDAVAAGYLAFELTHILVNESTVLQVRVRRLGGSQGAVSVNYASSNGSATQPANYTSVSNTLNWADADAADKTFNVTINTVTENGLYFTLTLSAPGGGAVLLDGYSVAQVVIVDTGNPPPQPMTDVLVEGYNDDDGPMMASVEYIDEMRMFARTEVTIIEANGINTTPNPDVISFAGGQASWSGSTDLTSADQTLEQILLEEKYRFKRTRAIFVPDGP